MSVLLFLIDLDMHTVKSTPFWTPTHFKSVEAKPIGSGAYAVSFEPFIASCRDPLGPARSKTRASLPFNAPSRRRWQLLRTREPGRNMR